MSQSPEHHRVIIIGTGFSGLGAAIKLHESGESDLVILERASDVGGCWRDNTYPGLQCDVQSVVYSFSFAPNPKWSRSFPWGSEIHSYLRDVADRHHLRRCIRFDTEVREARWNEDSQVWHVSTSRGDYTAEVLVSAHGALSAPSTPDIPGLDRFEGPVFHSANWRHDVSLEGKRVAVIGTGASAIQIIPSIQSKVSELHVYQRTPAWVLPRPDRPVSGARKLAYEMLPITQKLARGLRFGLLETRILGILTRPELLKLAQFQAKRFIASQVPDRRLRAALTPDYEMGCKRVLLSNEYYPAMCAPNVDLVTDGIREITADGIIDADGTKREVDAIVLCTGFTVADHPMTHAVRGRDGGTLAEHWSGGARALLGMTVPNFPNLFLLLTGPHTGLGHNSIVYMIESQLEYLTAALAERRARGQGVMEVRDEVVESFTREMEDKLDGTVWSSGCTSFYLDSAGRNIAIWPGFAMSYRRRTRRFDAAAFTFAAPSRAARVRPLRGAA